MSFRYTTEYSLGRRGRVCRSYTGIQALIAIGFDLTLGLVFSLVALALWVMSCCALLVYRITVALVSLPLRLIRAIRAALPAGAAAKPAWASFDEV